MTSTSTHRLAVALACMVTLLGACGSDNGSSDDLDLDLPNEVTATAEGVEVGQCFVTPDELDEMFAAVLTLDEVPCAEPHQLEAYHLFQIEFDAYPNRDEMTPAVDDGCYPAFQEFIGASMFDTSLQYEHLIPSPESWDEGDRTIACLALDDGRDVVGSLQGQGPAYPSPDLE